jgi:nucleoside 2-deoxyribosyltransferase
LAYLPKELNDRRPSYGTSIEIGWAIGLRKPLIVVSDDEYLTEHPLIKHNASWRFNNLEDAVEVIVGLFSDYVGPILP